MENINYKGYKITIEQDQFADDPRNWDNLGQMICWHRNYDLGDKHEFDEPQDFKTSFKHGDIALPLYLYDHSGLRMKVGNFNGLLPQGHAEFDTMCVGWIVARREKYLTEFNQKRTSMKIRDKVREILKEEVKAYDEFLSGQVYVASIEDEYGEQIDSMGDIHGYDEALQGAKEQVESYIAHIKPKARDKSVLGRMHV